MSNLAKRTQAFVDAIVEDSKCEHGNHHNGEETARCVIGPNAMDANTPLMHHSHADSPLTLAIRLLPKHDGYTSICRENNLINGPYLIDLLLRSGAYIGDPRAENAPKGLERAPQPLALAVKCDKPHILLQLIEHGAYLDAQGADGKTALHEAVLQHDRAMAVMLVKAGARIDIEDSSHKTARDYADKKMLRAIDKALPKSAEDDKKPGRFAEFFENMGRAYSHNTPTITGWHVP